MIGKRVQIPAWRDEWMRGDRYGTIVKITRPNRKEEIYHVRLDVSGRVLRIASRHLDGRVIDPDPEPHSSGCVCADHSDEPYDEA